jgi:tetratricopeptide (TPR) repeat protein
MPKIEANAIEKYQNILQKDPNSQVFAPLAEAYREMGMLKEAEQVIKVGVKRHPNFAAGFVVYARITRDLEQFEDCLKLAQKAAELAPENIMAHQMQAEIFLQTKHPKQALRAFKMVLFLNPQSEKARRAVSKLESLTADEYDDEVFEMGKLAPIKIQDPVIDPSAKVKTQGPPVPPRGLERMLSLIDAFIVRNDLNKAKLLLNDTQTEFGDHPELIQRMKLLHSRSGSMMNAPSGADEVATSLKPLVSRERTLQQRKLAVLETILRNVKATQQL